MFCPSCGKRLPDGAKFCTNCGHDLTASAEHAADTPEPDTAEAPPTQEGSTPEAPTAPAKRPTPKWLLALVAVLAIAVVGVGSYALTRAVTGQGADASQTTAKKADGGKKGTKPTSGTKVDAGKSDASGTSGQGNAGADEKSGAGEKNGGSAGSATSDDASYVVRAEGFQFALPSYWRGKVDVVVDEDEVDIYPKGYAPAAGDDHDKEPLATLELEDGTEPDVAGDIGNFLAYSQTLGSRHVEVWATNWPWLVASGNAGDTGVSSTSELRALVDLSTGGSLTYDDAVRRGEGDNLVGMAAHDYLAAVPWGIKAAVAGA